MAAAFLVKVTAFLHSADKLIMLYDSVVIKVELNVIACHSFNGNCHIKKSYATAQVRPLTGTHKLLFYMHATSQ